VVGSLAVGYSAEAALRLLAAFVSLSCCRGTARDPKRCISKLFQLFGSAGRSLRRKERIFAHRIPEVPVVWCGVTL
jgi:hypothetical protein